MAHMTPLDFRVTAAAQFRLFAAACSISSMSINNLNKIYSQEQLVNTRVLSPISLHDQANALIDKFKAMMQVQITPLRGIQFLHFIISQDGSNSAAHTNTFLTSVPGSNKFEAITNFYPKHDNVVNSSNYQNDFFECNTYYPVTYKAGIYDWALEPRPLTEIMTPKPPSVFIVPGMHVGCLPNDAMNLNTLECFFDSGCLNTTAQWISTLPAASWPKPLNSSMKSRFISTTSTNTLTEELMIEEWQNITNFSGYYAACLPASCTYMITKHSSILQILTIFIGSLGGLMVVLRTITPQLVKLPSILIYIISKRKRPNTNIQVQQFGMI
ncbi:unnamed protein product [Rotaria sp. Silwood2]|nr:unnamed protein product [Rotaria sp. Silwood2]CAF3376799.1 unnamed protein product [Rotaria sp. Silwood2]CAF4189701.1 unnamed protein product [Rotaria sp. Silwood2]